MLHWALQSQVPDSLPTNATFTDTARPNCAVFTEVAHKKVSHTLILLTYLYNTSNI